MSDYPAAGNMLPWLERLEAQWFRLNAPISALPKPGLSDRAINDLTAPYELSLPVEWQTWWQWHDGADLPLGADTNGMTIGPGPWAFLSLGAALTQYEFNRRTHPDSEPQGLFWHATWLPFMTQGAERLYVDCADVASDGSSPVRLVSWEWEHPTVPRAMSLTHVLTLWVWLLESDFYYWNADAPRPHWAQRDDPPAFVEWTGLA